MSTAHLMSAGRPLPGGTYARRLIYTRSWTRPLNQERASVAAGRSGRCRRSRADSHYVRLPPIPTRAQTGCKGRPGERPAVAAMSAFQAVELPRGACERGGQYGICGQSRGTDGSRTRPPRN
jgi:hypothetical protein